MAVPGCTEGRGGATRRRLAPWLVLAAAVAVLLGAYVRWATWCPVRRGTAAVRGFRVSRTAVGDVVADTESHTLLLMPGIGLHADLVDYLSGRIRRVRLSRRTGGWFDDSLGGALDRGGRRAAVMSEAGAVMVVDIQARRELHCFRADPGGGPLPTPWMRFDTTGRYVSLDAGEAALDVETGQVWVLDAGGRPMPGRQLPILKAGPQRHDTHRSAGPQRPPRPSAIEWLPGFRDVSLELVLGMPLEAGLDAPVQELSDDLGGNVEACLIGEGERLGFGTTRGKQGTKAKTAVRDFRSGRVWQLADIAWTDFVHLDEQRGLVVLVDHPHYVVGRLAGTRVWVLRLPGYAADPDGGHPPKPKNQ